ncbi:MAG: SGNH/GDSL hydrolase family protein [Armatimonadota bacterium]|nr:SGNH/GDSL hydrolase family protein [Armatimonadota bacterium]
MSIADRRTYLANIVDELKTQWPENRTVNIVCHGHSVPAGYHSWATVETFKSYPHLFHCGLKERFAFAVVNVIVTAIGGEESDKGAARFDSEVLNHNPRVLTIDYGLNDRRIGLEKAEASWRSMIEKSLQRDIELVLLTPTHDNSGLVGPPEYWESLRQQAGQIRKLADEYEVGLVDSFALYERCVGSGGDLSDLLSWPNHPNRNGHQLVADDLLRWFPIG